MKKWLFGLFSALCILMPTVAFASPFPTQTAPVAIVQATTAGGSTAQVQPIRGHSFGHSFGSRSFGSRSYGSRSYSSSRSSSRSYTSPRGFGGFGSHFASFGFGLMMGHLFNPFGYGYGYGAGLGLFHIVLDIFIIWIVWKLIRRMF